MKFGAGNYRDGALERLRESQTLLLSRQFAGSIYMAGRSVEGMLRAVIWKGDVDIQTGRKALETGHDLQRLLSLVSNLGLLRREQRDEDFKVKVQRVARLWSNDFKFASTPFIESGWQSFSVVTKRRTLKIAVQGYFQDCSDIIKRCEMLWQK